MKRIFGIMLLMLASYLIGLQPQLEYSPQYFCVELTEGSNSTEILYLSNTGDQNLNYNLNFCYQERSFENRDIEGSQLICLSPDFMPGCTTNWILEVTNLGSDENLMDILIIFPEEITLLSIGNFIGGSGGDLEYLIESSQDNIIFWHGSDENGNGFILPGETAQTVLELEIDPCCYYDLITEYHLYGDQGNMEDGTFMVSTLCIGWCSICSSTGEIEPGETEEVDINFCALNIEPGVYEADLKISDNCRDQHIVPLQLEIEVAANEEPVVPVCVPSISNAPNPFNPETKILYELASTGFISVYIYDIKGRPVRKLIEHTFKSEGKSEIIWDGKDDKGKVQPDGIYLCNLNTSTGTITTKMCLLK